MTGSQAGLALRWLTTSEAVDDELSANLLVCWREVSNAGGAVGFPFLPVGDEHVRPAVDAMVQSLDPALNRLLIATDGATLAGWLLLAGNASKLTRHWATLLRVQTALNYRGTGVGRALMTEATRAAQGRLRSATAAPGTEGRPRPRRPSTRAAVGSRSAGGRERSR